MPYTKSNPPARIKKLPTHAQSIWISAFNSALVQYKDEGKANAVAWAAVKRDYKKVNNKWVRKASENSNMIKNTLLRHLSEIKFDFKEGQMTSEIQVLPYGTWSHNEYGKIKIDNKALSEYVFNFESKIRNELPITEGHPVGSEEKPAIGWFKKLVSKGRQGLWATIEWTQDGIDLLKKKAYKYFSPEFYSIYEDQETHKIYHNVLDGGALVNKPYFKGLQAVMLSEFTFDENAMELKDLLEKEVSELTDDEKVFVKEHVEELTDEQKETYKDVLKVEKDDDKDDDSDDEDDENDSDDDKDEDEDEDEEDDDDDSNKGSEKMIQMSEKSLKVLENNAKQGVRAMAELRRKDAENYVKRMSFSETNQNGLLLPKSQDKVVGFLLSLTEKQQKDFKAILVEMPRGTLFSELGEADGVKLNASEQILKLAEAKMSKDKELTLKQATEQVLAGNAELAKLAERE